MSFRFIRLQFILQDCFASNAIAWFSQGHFSHVDCVMPDGNLLGARSDMVGGQSAGVRIRTPGYANFSRRVIFSLAVSPVQEDEFYRFLKKQLGKPYDHEAIWAFALNRDWRENDSWICSELQAAALENSAALPCLYLAANKITPVGLALALSAAGAKHIVY